MIIPHKKLTLIIATAILAVTAVAAYFYTREEEKEEPKDFPQIADEGILHVVTDYNTVGFFVKQDTIAGFNHDLLQAFGKSINLKLDIHVENNLEKSIRELNDGRFDLLARTIPANSSLIDEVSFTQPIIRNKLVLVQYKHEKGDEEQPVRSLLDLAHDTIYVAKGSPAILRLKNLSYEIGDTIYVREDSLYESSQLIMKVAAREIKFAVCDAAIAANMARSIPEVDIKTDIGFTHLESWAVSKRSPILLDSLNAWLERFRQTKEFDKIYRTYYRVK